MAYYPIDLHTHTTASDGKLSPTELVERAADRGVKILGVADHDTLGGLAEAQTAGDRLGVEIVPGTEISLKYEPEKGFIGLHLLGYFIDPQHPALVRGIKKIQQGRLAQKIEQIKKLQSFGFDISVEAVLSTVSGVPGRPHIAMVLMERNPGRFQNFQQVFDEYLGAGARAHVKRPFALRLKEAITLIQQAGGIAVLAHPGVYQSKANPITIIRNAHAEGLDGVEVYYPYNRNLPPAEDGSPWVERVNTIADELNLLKTGGTDFHGRPYESSETGDMGLTHAQYAALTEGRQRLGRNHSAKEQILP